MMSEMFWLSDEQFSRLKPMFPTDTRGVSRVDAARIATRKSAEAAAAAGFAAAKVLGSVMASDAFFPFADGLLEAVAGGATAVIQPGGSRRDDEIIRAADDHGLAMVFTGIRHFRH